MIGGAVSLTISVIIVKLLGVLYKIPLASVLSDEGMGYFNSAYTVYSFFYLLCTAGVPKAVMILVSEERSTEKGNASAVIKSAVLAFSFIGILTALFFSLFSEPLSEIIGSPGSKITMICIAPSIIFTAVSGVLRGLLNADMRLFEIALSQIIEGALKLAAGLLLALLGVRLGLPVYLISALAITGATIGSFASLIYLFVISKNKNISFNLEQNEKIPLNRGALKSLFKISLPITVSAALMSLSGLLDLFLIMRRLEGIGYTASEATALYGNYTTLAVSMFNLGVALITPISMSVMPILAGSHASGDRYSFDLSLKKSLNFTAFLTAPIVVGFCVFSEEILALLFGSEAASAGAPLLLLLSPGIIFMSYILILNSALESLKRPGLAMLSMTVSALVKLTVSGILLGVPEIGISGAPIGTVISYSVAMLLSLLMLSHMLGYNIPVLSSAFLPYLTAGVSVMSARLFYDRIFFGINATASLLLSILASAIIYLALSGLFALRSPKMSIKMAKSTNFG